MLTRAALLALVLALLAGCGHVIRPELAPNYGKRFDFSDPPCRLSPQPVLRDDEAGLRYFGAGGLYIEWRGAALLMAPYFTNPGLFRVLRGRLESDPGDIEYGLSGMDLSRVRAIAAGHSHYDHIGDLPILATKLPAVPIYVNRTGANALAITPISADRIHPLEKEADWIRLRDAAGRDLPIRFRKVATQHAPHFWGIHLGKDEIRTPWTKPWREHHFLDLQEGQPYSFVIELLSRNNNPRPLFRIYYEDSANPEGQGVPDVAGPYDLAALVMASFRFVRNHPGFILDRIKPRHVLVIHYEDFFQDRSEPVRFVFPLIDSEANRFLRRTRDALGNGPTQGPEGRVCGPSSSGWTMPMPGEWVRFRVQGD